jgi:hypothetical protein
MERSMARGSLFGKTAPSMRGCSGKMISKVMASTSGQMDALMRALGLITRCTGEAFSNGRIRDSTKETITETKRKATGFLLGQTEDST